MRFFVFISSIIAVLALASCGATHSVLNREKLDYKIEKQELLIDAIEESLTKEEVREEMKLIKEDYKNAVKKVKKNRKKINRTPVMMSSGGGNNKKPPKNNSLKNKTNIVNKQLKKELKELKREYKDLKNGKIEERYVFIESFVDTIQSIDADGVPDYIDVEISNMIMSEGPTKESDSWMQNTRNLYGD